MKASNKTGMRKLAFLLISGPLMRSWRDQKLSFCLANIYLFKVNNRNTRKRYEICSNLTKKTPQKNTEEYHQQNTKTGCG